MPALTDRLNSHLRQDTFRRAYPRTAAMLPYLNQLYKILRRSTHKQLYRRFRSFTMIPQSGYLENLALCDTVRHLPGAIVECGTWKGGMIAGIASLLGPDRHYYLYDSYEGLPPAGLEDRDQCGDSGQEWDHRLRAAESDAREAMRRSGATQVTIIKGWFEDTLPHYAGTPIAILRADADWYASTKEILTHLFPSVVPGGIVILDDYYYWDGCAKAVHEYLIEHPTARLRQFGEYAYIEKRR